MAQIFTRNGQCILVDDADFERLNAFSWHISNGYAYRNAQHAGAPGGRYKQSIHREVFGLVYGDAGEIDHRDGNKLDNRRANLRHCDHAGNCMNKGPSSHNTSGFKGVSFIKSAGKWRAAIQVQRKNKHLGFFDSPEIAHAAYVEAAKIHHGEFARA